MSLQIEIAGIKFKNPIWASAGSFGFGIEAIEFLTLSKLGAFVTKGLSLNPIEGNPPPRIAKTPCGMINSIGLQNPGAEAFIKEIYPVLEKANVDIIVNVFCTQVSECVSLCQKLESLKNVLAYELNVSCPNVKEGGILFCQSERALSELISSLKSSTSKPIFVKFPPNSGLKTYEIAINKGASALVISNTWPAMKIDTTLGKIDLIGGLSGPAIFPLTLRAVYEARSEFKTFPIIASGGAYSIESVLELIMAGANAIEIGSEVFCSPTLPFELIKNLETFASQKPLPEIFCKAHLV
ncbi:MAG: dihydroorotate dehydrogenase [Aquificaceae bacterium]|nr:dihydroorotate dehydrogenase [Aquificaceae bacterium]